MWIYINKRYINVFVIYFSIIDISFRIYVITLYMLLGVGMIHSLFNF